MKTNEFEQRLPRNVKLLSLRLRKGEVVRAEAIVTDSQGKTTNMRLVYASDGKAYARWMVQGLPKGDVFVDGWKYKRFEKYDLLSVQQEALA